jgi:T5SS/PEP-CTERM-associated repeat protein
MTRVYFNLKYCAMAAAAAAGLVAVSPLLAGEDIWKTAADGVWGAGASWVDNTTPVDSDEATFNLPGTYTATFNADPQPISRLTVTNNANVTLASGSLPPNPVQTRTLQVTTPPGSGDVLIADDATLTLGASSSSTSHPFRLSARVITLTNDGTLDVKFGSNVVGAGVSVGELGKGTLNITNGRVQGHFGVVGYGNGGDGEAVVSGSNSRWEIVGLTVGEKDGGRGALSITGGAQVHSDLQVFVGSEADGTVTVSGAGSILNTGRLLIGFFVDGLNPGAGRINIQPGATVSVSGETVIFRQGSRLRLQGGTFDTEELRFEGSGQFEWTSGTFHVGRYHGNLVQPAGTLAPGHSAGSTTVLGDYTQQSAGILEIEIGGLAQGTQHDVLNVTGNALVGGRLDLSLIDGFVPTPGDNFVVLSANMVSGAFNNVANGQRLATADGAGSFLVHYGPNSAFDPTLVLLSSFQTSGLPGDYNHNGVVDAADYVVWRDMLSQSGPGLAADGNGNGVIDAGDYDVWRAHFGQTTGSGSGVTAGLPGSVDAAVPEPASLALVCLFAVALLGFRRQDVFSSGLSARHAIEGA